MIQQLPPQAVTNFAKEGNESIIAPILEGQKEIPAEAWDAFVGHPKRWVQMAVAQRRDAPDTALLALSKNADRDVGITLARRISALPSEAVLNLLTHSDPSVLAFTIQRPETRIDADTADTFARSASSFLRTQVARFATGLYDATIERLACDPEHAVRSALVDNNNLDLRIETLERLAATDYWTAEHILKRTQPIPEAFLLTQIEKGYAEAVAKVRFPMPDAVARALVAREINRHPLEIGAFGIETPCMWLARHPSPLPDDVLISLSACPNSLARHALAQRSQKLPAEALENLLNDSNEVIRNRAAARPKETAGVKI